MNHLGLLYYQEYCCFGREQNKPVDICIGPQQISIHSLIYYYSKETIRKPYLCFKSGNPSIIQIGILKLGYSVPSKIYVPVPKESETEALDIIKKLNEI